MIDNQTPLQSELAPGETILWSGRPDPLQMRRDSMGYTAFGVLWLVFCLIGMWVQHSMSGPTDPWELLLEIPFILIGIIFIVKPWTDAAQGKSTEYAVTNRRIITLVQTRGSRNLHSFEPAQITDLEYTQRPDGVGTLLFSMHYVPDGRGGQYPVRHRLFGIPNVAGVARLIHENLATRIEPTETKPPLPTDPASRRVMNIFSWIVYYIPILVMLWAWFGYYYYAGNLVRTDYNAYNGCWRSTNTDPANVPCLDGPATIESVSVEPGHRSAYIAALTLSVSPHETGYIGLDSMAEEQNVAVGRTVNVITLSGHPTYLKAGSTWYTIGGTIPSPDLIVAVLGSIFSFIGIIVVGTFIWKLIGKRFMPRGTS